MPKVPMLVKIEKSEKESLAREASALGLSLSDVVRLKCRKPLSLTDVPAWVPRIES